MMTNPDYCTYDKLCLWRFCKDETGNLPKCPYDSKTTTELYLKEETNMAKATKKVTVSQVELGKEVNEREQKLKDQIKLLKEQNTCLAKRCKALEEQRDNLVSKDTDLKNVIVRKDVKIRGLETTIGRLRNDRDELLDRVEKLEFSRDCIINGACLAKDEYSAKVKESFNERLEAINKEVNILKDYYINKMSIEDIMEKYLICESIVRHIVFHNTTHDKSHSWEYPYGSGDKPYGEL